MLTTSALVMDPESEPVFELTGRRSFGAFELLL